VDSWHAAHLAALGVWAGVVAAEAVIELTPRTDADGRHAATLHYWIDLVIEVPVLLAVLATGAVLVARAWPLSALHYIKVGAGLAAVGANAWCVAHVVVRRRRLGDAGALHRHARWVRTTATVGLPFAALALYLGLSYFG
jgi:hypothetical protein